MSIVLDFFFFSIFLGGGVINADLSNNQNAFSAPAPVASTSKAHLQTTSEPAAKKGKKSPSPEVEEGVEVDEESDSGSAEEEDEEEDGDGEDNDAELSEIDEELPDEDDDEDISGAESDNEAAKAKEIKKAKKSKLGKYVPAEESVQDKNRRTAFIGNLPIDAAKSKVSLFLPHCFSFLFVVCQLIVERNSRH